MLNGGPSGFQNAPVSKVITIGVVASSVMVNSLHLRRWLELGELANLLQFQIWRLVTCQFFFTSASELLFGMLLLYFFRLFERQMGSAKFAAFVALSSVLSSAFVVAAMVLFPNSATNPSNGPYSIIFACFVLFFMTVPSTYRFRVCGINANDKLFAYILGLQLVLANAPNSLVAAVAGILAGIAYRSEALKLNRFQFPAVINNFCYKFILPLVQSSPNRAIQRTPIPIGTNQRQAASQQTYMNFGNQQFDQQQFQSAFMNTHTAFAPQPPSEESIEMLCSMGFARDSAVQALQSTNNDLERATLLLLDQGT